MKKIISMFIVTIFCFLPFTACSNNKSAEIYNQHIGEEVDSSEMVSESTQPETKTLSGELRISTYYPEESFTEMKRAFNKKYPDVKITIDYALPNYDSVTPTPRDYIQKTAVELMSGGGSDIINLSMMSYQRYGKSGLLTDFNELMNNDPDFNRGDYYTNIFDAMTTEDGKMYVFAPSFTYHFFYFNKFITDKLSIDMLEYDSINYIQMAEIYNEALAQGYITPDCLFAETQNKTMFETLEYSEFYNEQNGTATFNTPKFIDYLIVTNNLNFDRTVRSGMGYSQNMPKFSSDNFFCQMTLFAFDSQTRTFANGDPNYPFVSNAVFYETQSGQRNFSPSSLLAIPENCKNKELAWEFVKFQIEEKEFDEEDLKDTNPNIYFPIYAPYLFLAPINKNNFHKLATAKFLEEKHAIYFDEINNSLNNMHNTDAELLYAIAEIQKSFYDDGLISAEECARQIQERAEIFLKE